jgi:DNA-binding transcriptional LysR family regulator
LHVLPVLTEFLSAFPDVGVSLVLTDRIAHFLDDHVDVALRIGPLPDSSLIATRLGSVRRVVCASPAYLSTRGTPMSPDDLVRHSVISFDNVSSSTSWTFQVDGIGHSVNLRSRLSVNTIDAAIEAGLLGAGLARVVSYQVVDLVRSDRMRVVLESFEVPPRPVHLIYDQQNRLPLKLRAFVDFAVPRLRARLTEASL